MNGMELKKLMDVTVAKAVKEFAEKISNKIDRIYGKEPYKTLHYFEICDRVDSIIDELLKEYEK